MLELKHISKTFYPGTVNAKTALFDLNLTLNDGDFVTVIGGNGAGKSTMLNAIAGAFSVDSGSIIIDGKNVTKLPEYKRAAFIGRVFQDPMMGTAPTMGIEENLALAARRGKRRTLRWGIKKVEREDYRELLRMHNSQLTRPVVQVSICREKRFLDPRVAMLLTLTDETQSVRAACQRMQLSYSSGWNAINLLEAELGYPVVARTQGGQRGGRSSLTEKGRALLRAYEAYTLRLRAMADELFVQYFPDLFK